MREMLRRVGKMLDSEWTPLYAEFKVRRDYEKGRYMSDTKFALWSSYAALHPFAIGIGLGALYLYLFR